MTWRIAAIPALALVLSAAHCSHGQLLHIMGDHPDTTEPGWRDLLENDLSNAIRPDGIWRYDGELLSASEDEAIWTTEKHGRFVLDLEYKTSPGANAGVILYASSPENWVSESVEIQILDDSYDEFSDFPEHWRNASFFGHKAPDTTNARPLGSWNRMTIRADGPHIAVVLNGEPVNAIDLRKWTSARRNPDGSEIPEWLDTPKADLLTEGHIGLQGRHGEATVWYRRIRIREL